MQHNCKQRRDLHALDGQRYEPRYGQVGELVGRSVGQMLASLRPLN